MVQEPGFANAISDDRLDEARAVLVHRSLACSPNPYAANKCDDSANIGPGGLFIWLGVGIPFLLCCCFCYCGENIKHCLFGCKGTSASSQSTAAAESQPPVELEGLAT